MRLKLLRTHPSATASGRVQPERQDPLMICLWQCIVSFWASWSDRFQRKLSDNLLYLPRYGDTPAAAYVVEPKWQQMKLYGFKCIARVRHYQAEYCLTDPSNIVCLWNTIVTKLASAKFVCFVMPWFGLSVHVCRNVVCVKTDLYYDRSLSLATDPTKANRSLYRSLWVTANFY